jgi:hypothetical protein
MVAMPTVPQCHETHNDSMIVGADSRARDDQETWNGRTSNDKCQIE